ncbi:MAG: MerR family DNA-binding protein [Phenylobacterium sp.]|nr:MerR family DNA-binding protein [Phenylobacterium sp.]MBI1196236.1 MerR family DNA-binding protein [Phenylobacterium sp.]
MSSRRDRKGRCGRSACSQLPTSLTNDLEGNRRIYGEESVRRLTFIKHARQLGFPVEAVRALLALSDEPERPCDEADTLAADQLAAVDGKIASLQALQAELRRMVEAACHGKVSDCRVIDVLSDHAACQHHIPEGHAQLGFQA